MLSIVSVESSVAKAPQPGFYVQRGDLAPQSSSGLDGEIVWHPVIFDLSTNESKDAVADFSEPFKPSLEPGEQMGLTLYLNGSNRFDGELKIVAQSGEQQRTTTIPVLTGDEPEYRVPWPGIDSDTSFLVLPVDGELRCILKGETGTGSRCSPTAIASIVA